MVGNWGSRHSWSSLLSWKVLSSLQSALMSPSPQQYRRTMRAPNHFIRATLLKFLRVRTCGIYGGSFLFIFFTFSFSCRWLTKNWKLSFLESSTADIARNQYSICYLWHDFVRTVLLLCAAYLSAIRSCVSHMTFVRTPIFDLNVTFYSEMLLSTKNVSTDWSMVSADRTVTSSDLFFRHDMYQRWCSWAS